MIPLWLTWVWVAVSLSGAVASLFAAYIAVKAIRRQDRELDLLRGIHGHADTLKNHIVDGD